MGLQSSCIGRCERMESMTSRVCIAFGTMYVVVVSVMTVDGYVVGRMVNHTGIAPREAKGMKRSCDFGQGGYIFEGNSEKGRDTTGSKHSWLEARRVRCECMNPRSV
jgi:hypothetical protein